MSYELHAGDCIDVLSTLPEKSVDAVVTSPPYAMQRKSTYGGIPEKDYPAWTVAWMEQVRRVLKDDGSVIINISPHVKDGQLSDYVLRTRLELRGAGWAELGELIWHKTTAMPTGHARRPRRAWESLLWYGKHGKAWSDARANGVPAKWDVNVRKQGQHTRHPEWGIYAGGGGKRVNIARQSDVLPMFTVRETTGHPAAFAWQLAEWCGKLITPPGGTILDPFTGSSSTGVAAIRNGWSFIGIDQSPEYIEMSDRRLGAELAKAIEGGAGEPAHQPHGKPTPTHQRP